MPTLDWIGKKAVLNHHREVPFHLLEEVPELSAGDPDSGNLLVQGDNLLALKALLPYYAGQVKCIYIDPPYNTGVDERDASGKRTGWIYDDNVSSPEIRDWLNRVVGQEAEDLSRHDKWLCMMYPRIAVLREFLRNDGVIFVSIDDGELANLRGLLDQIFGAGNHVGTIIWKNATDNNPTNIAVEHEYVVCYAKDRGRLPSTWKSETLKTKQLLLEKGDELKRSGSDQAALQKEYTKWFRQHRPEIWPFQDYKFIDDGGIYTGMRAVHNPGKEGYRYDVLHPVTGNACAQPLMGYRFPEDTMQQLLADGRILFGKDESKIIELKVYVRDYRAKLSSLFDLDGRVGTNELKEIFPDNKRPFDFPKPTALIMELLSFVTSGSDLILDSFAGSGTTGHAVLQLNAIDGHDRRFILVERKAEIGREIAAVRLSRIVRGFSSRRRTIPSLGSGFRFCTLGDALFDESGTVRSDISFEELALHVFFTETGSPLNPGWRTNAPLLGTHEGEAVYLLYNGILGDKKPDGGNILTGPILDSLPSHAGPKIIYGEGCRLGKNRLAKEQITFRQIPYEIKVR